MRPRLALLPIDSIGDASLQRLLAARPAAGCGPDPFTGGSLPAAVDELSRRDPPDGPDGELVAALCGDELVGMCGFIARAWDAELFGHAVGRVDPFWAVDRSVAASLTAWAFDRAAAADAKFMSVRVPVVDLVAAQALEAVGFRFMEVLRHPWYELASWSDSGPRCTRSATIDDIEAMARIARTAFAGDRFHRDEHVPASIADALYEKWVRGWLLPQTWRQGARVLEVSGAVRAFVLYAITQETGGEGAAVARMQLTAVDRDSWGMGLATRLYRDVLAWLGREAEYAVGAYSLGNAAMVALHNRLGATYGSAGELTFHLWRDTEDQAGQSEGDHHITR